MRATPYAATLLAVALVAGGARAAPIAQQAPPPLGDELPLGLTVHGPPQTPLGRVRDLIEAHAFDKAVAAARAYIKIHPDDPEGLDLYGAALALSGKLDAALEPLRRAVAIKPDQWTAQTRIGDILAAQGQRDEAKRAYLQAVAMWPEARRAHQRLGLIYEAEGQPKRAMAEYEKGISGLAHQHVDVMDNLAQLYNRARRFDEALRLLAPVLPPSSDDAFGEFVLGTTYLGLGRDGDAQARFNRIAQLDPGSDRANLARGLAYDIIGDPDKARREFALAVVRQPGSSAAHVALAQADARIKRYDDAVAELKRATALDPDAVAPKKLLGDVLMQKGDRAQAIEAYRAVSVSPKAGPDVFDALGTAYQLSGNVSEAEATFKTMVERFPNDGRSYLKLGAYYGFVRNYPLAARTLAKGLLIAPGNVDLERAYAVAEERLGHADAAIAAQEKVVEDEPDDLGAVAKLAMMLDRSGYDERAANLYRKVLSKAPNAVPMLNNLALLLGARGQVDDGLAMAEKAARLAPKSPNVADTHGWLLHLAGRDQEALAILAPASQAATKDPSVGYHLAVVQAAVGDKAAARTSLERVLKLTTDFREAGDARRLLQALK